MFTEQLPLKCQARAERFHKLSHLLLIAVPSGRISIFHFYD